MSRPKSGYGSRYQCPDCRQNVDRNQPYHRVGPWVTHAGCRAFCVLCGREITPPMLGKAHTVSVWCGEPCHTACKEAQ